MINNITMIYEGVYALNELKKFYNINAKIGELKKNGYEILTIAHKKYVDQKNAERMIAEFCEKFEFARYDEYLKEWMAPEIHEQGVMEIIDSEIWADDEHEYNRIAYIYCTLDGDEFRAEEISEEFIAIEEQAEDDGIEDLEPEDWELDETIDFDIPAAKPEEAVKIQAVNEDNISDELKAIREKNRIEFEDLKNKLNEICGDIISVNSLDDVNHPIQNAIADVKVMATRDRKIEEEIEIYIQDVEDRLVKAVKNKFWRSATRVVLPIIAEWFNTKRSIMRNDIEYAANALAVILKECKFDKLGSLDINEIADEELEKINVKNNAENKTYSVIFEACKLLGFNH